MRLYNANKPAATIHNLLGAPSFHRGFVVAFDRLFELAGALSFIASINSSRNSLEHHAHRLQYAHLVLLNVAAVSLTSLTSTAFSLWLTCLPYPFINFGSGDTASDDSAAWLPVAYQGIY